MRRIGRHLLAILAAASLLLCLAVLADWCTHPWRTNCYGTLLDCSRLTTLVAYIQGGGGNLQLHLTYAPKANFLPHRSPDFFYQALGPGFIRSDSWLRRRGFFYWRDQSGEVMGLSLPSWFLATLFAILPAVRIRGMLRDRKRNRAGLCPTCGYDLRAHAAGERCPECGMAVGR